MTAECRQHQTDHQRIRQKRYSLFVKSFMVGRNVWSETCGAKTQTEMINYLSVSVFMCEKFLNEFLFLLLIREGEMRSAKFNDQKLCKARTLLRSSHYIIAGHSTHRRAPDYFQCHIAHAVHSLLFAFIHSSLHVLSFSFLLGFLRAHTSR